MTPRRIGRNVPLGSGVVRERASVPDVIRPRGAEVVRPKRSRPAAGFSPSELLVERRAAALFESRAAQHPTNKSRDA